MRRIPMITTALSLTLLGFGCGNELTTDYLPAVTQQGTHVLGEDVATATIGSGGGALVSSDGRLSITVPAGALATDTQISIDPVTNHAPVGVGHAYRLSPDDTEFSTPATLEFKVADEEIQDISIQGLRIAFQNEASIWQIPGEIKYDAESKTVAVETDHLSDWSLVKGAILMPMTAEVKVGKSVGLGVRNCYASPDLLDGLLAPLGYDCADNLAPLVVASEWSVNGIQGGDATVGTISGSGLQATYRAPASAPSPDTVAVSARLDDDTIVFAYVTIKDEATALTGTVDFSFTYLTAPEQTFKATATVSLTVEDDGIDETNYHAVGTLELTEPLSFNIDDTVCTVEGASKPVNEDYFLKVLKDPLSVRLAYSEAWIYHCTGKATFDIMVQMYFITGTGTGCINFDDVPITDANAPEGEYTADCNGAGVCTAKWAFN